MNPDMLDHRCVLRNDEHNAFTSLCRFNGRIYLAFRSATDHLAFDGRITVMVSDDDGRNFHECARLFDAGDDMRDPGLVAFGGELLAYYGVRIREGDSFRIESRLYSSRDGESFRREPLSGLLNGSFLWQVREHGGALYGTSYLYTPPSQSAGFYGSRDGRVWEIHGSFVAPGNECAFDIDRRGVVHAVLRDERPPWRPRYITFPLDRIDEQRSRVVPCAMQGVMIHCEDDGKLLAARRWDGGAARENLRVELFELRDDGTLRALAKLPSGGDCSYAACLALADGDRLLSYYSAHRSWGRQAQDPEHDLPADIYTVRLRFAPVKAAIAREPVAVS